MSFTPSPWVRTCSAIGDSGPSAPVTMNLMRPCCSRWDTRSRRPVSGPAYATSSNPNAEVNRPAKARAFPTHHST